jgi:O-acetyl-ADP-ribose deacetylase (regulator of RNase III)
METDAIVNAANSGLSMGGGVCGAIFKAAGADKMAEACRRIGRCPAGEAVITDGFALRAKKVIHAVGPVYRGGTEGEPRILRGCYLGALALAKRSGLESIAFPLISAGIYGYPRGAALETAIGAIRDFFYESAETGRSAMRVFLVFMGETADLADPELPPRPSPAAFEAMAAAEAEAEAPEPLAPALERLRPCAIAQGRAAMLSNIEFGRMSALLQGAEFSMTEVLSLALGQGWGPGPAAAALKARSMDPARLPGWPVVAHYLAKGGADVFMANRSLFALGHPTLP